MPGLTSWAMRLRGGIPLKVAHGQRPRADQAHVPAQDVLEGRRFVQAPGAEEPAQTRRPIRIGQPGAIRRDRVGHGPELEELERLAVPARPHLAEQDRPPEPEADGDGDGRRQGRGDDQGAERPENIDHPLDEASPPEWSSGPPLR